MDKHETTRELIDDVTAYCKTVLREEFAVALRANVNGSRAVIVDDPFFDDPLTGGAPGVAVGYLRLLTRLEYVDEVTDDPSGFIKRLRSAVQTIAMSDSLPAGVTHVALPVPSIFFDVTVFEWFLYMRYCTTVKEVEDA